MSVIGTDLKIKVNVSPIGTVHLEDCDFTCTFFVNDKKVTKTKAQMVRLDRDNYLALVDSTSLGIGTVKMTIKLEVPDTDFPDQTRTEIDTICTGIEIRREDTY